MLSVNNENKMVRNKNEDCLLVVFSLLCDQRKAEKKWRDVRGKFPSSLNIEYEAT